MVWYDMIMNMIVIMIMIMIMAVAGTVDVDVAMATTRATAIGLILRMLFFWASEITLWMHDGNMIVSLPYYDFQD